VNHQPKTALITGMDGFVGPWLARHLLEEGRHVAGTWYSGLDGMPAHLKVLEDRVTLLPVDLEREESVGGVVRTVRPDEVYHLAGISHVPTSWKKPLLTWRVNIMGSAHLLEALRGEGRAVRVLVVTSAEVYGKIPPEKLPASENLPLNPENPYAGSKAALDILALQWSRFPGFHIIRARPFSHAGPGQAPGFVCPDFSRQVAAIALRKAPPVIKVGDLSARRDFTDVRDVVRAYRLLMEKGENGCVYNICSGESRRIADILETLRAFCPVPFTVEADPDRFRPIEVPETRGSHELLTRVTGWAPAIPFDQTLRDIYEESLALLTAS